MMQRRTKLILLPLALALTLGALALGYAWWQLHKPLALPEVLEVPRGTSLNGLLREFEREQIIGSLLVTKVALRIYEQPSTIQSGDYELAAPTSLAQLLKILNQGSQQLSYKFTIVEGQNWRETAQKLWGQAKLEPSLANMNSRAILQRIDPDSPHQYLEGLLLAETYLYRSQSSDLSVLAQAYTAMQDLLAQMWPERDPDLPISSPYEALILASVVEKETSLPEERPRIAAVFYNRLRIDMPLQSDPTTIYGLGEKFDGNLRRVHLRDRANPYNTYVHKKLPPSPIAMVARESLEAVLHPDSSDELYFVSRGDGSHQFSTNLRDHNRAVRKYQLKR